MGVDSFYANRTGFVATRLEKLRAAGHIGEKDRERAAFGHGAVDDR